MSKRKIVAGISFSWLRFVIGFLVVLFQTPLYFKYLPKEVVGVWFLFFSAAAFLQMSDFGLPSAVSRAIAYIKNNQFKSKQPEVEFYNRYSVKDIYHSAFTSFFILSAVVVIVGTILILLFQPGFGVAQISSSSISYAFAIFLGGVFFNMTASIPNACLNGLGDVGLDNLFRIIIQLIGFIAIFIILPILPSIITLSCIYLIQGLISTCFVHWFLGFRHKEILQTKGQFDKLLIKKLYKESIPLFINQIGGWLTNQSGIWIATIVLGASQIADYSVLLQLIFYGLSISMAIPSAINPYATSAFSIEGVKGVYKYFFLTLKLSSFIVGFWVIIIAIWGNSILDLWIGTGHFLGYGVLIPLLINLFLEMQHSITGGFVWNTGKWPFVPATIAAGILNVIIGFIGCYYWGFIGLAFGTMIAKLFTLNWYVVFYTLQRLHISLTQYFRWYFYPIIIVIISTFGIAYVTNKVLVGYQFSFSFRILSGNVAMSFFIGSIIVFIFWSIFFYLFVMRKNEKDIFKNILNRIKYAKQ